MTPENFEISKPKEETVVDSVPETLPTLPLRDVVIFPYMIFPVLVGREHSINAANRAADGDKYIFLAAQKKSTVDAPGPDDIYLEGTVARIVQILKLPNGLMKILVDGLLQARALEYHDRGDFFEAKIEVIVHNPPRDSEMDALIRQASQLFRDYVKINRNIPSEAITSFDAIDEPDRKLFYAAANVNQSIEAKQAILQKFDLKEQYFELIELLKSEIDVLKIEKEIDGKVQENIAQTQRKFIIKEQIKILQDELGEEEEESSDEVAEWRERIEKAKMPKAARDKAEEELDKLRKTPPMSPEYVVVRNYLDWLTTVPWKKRSKDNLDVERVQKILDEDHFGLEKPKERVIEHIAVLNLVKRVRGQILCFVGPPGVGKTSLGKSIARALNRKFARISLGGVRDEAEIRGHRRTYIGSMPGKIIAAMKRAGVVNPVILLDEIDKLSSDFRGDPSSAMLEALDPEQNVNFNDHYLEVDYDLSDVFFITTANVRHNIPAPLLDRMEIIQLNGYLEYDKIEIAKRHLIPKQLENHGLDPKKVIFEDDAIKAIVADYTREAGVRNMERELASLMRKIAKEIAVNGAKAKHAKRVVTAEKTAEALGAPRFKQRRKAKANAPGGVIGLAWTSAGGEILAIDVALMNGREKLTLTGQLGDVMKESAQAALSYLRANAKKLGLPAAFHKDKEVHVHIPEGSIPKDGPSAGLTLAMALMSAIKGVAPAQDVAMTGEITLQGLVLPVGGLTEKLLAAKRHGVKTVILPKENEIDLDEIQEKVKSGLKIVPVETIADAIPIVFPKRRAAGAAKKPAAKKPAAKKPATKRSR
ncbi:MAG: endopeptidase La [Ignavibacteriales bacterium]|nr:endopeptidase La [Ignavibacteriales bacterium]